MNSYIFITTEGHTYQPQSESIEPDIENCQVIGFAAGPDESEAFKNLLRENPHLLTSTFSELTCYQLKYAGLHKHRHFDLDDCRQFR